MNVPPATHPTWTELVTGKRQFEPAFVAARMLIVRSRMKAVQARGDLSHLAGLAGELRELYAANNDCRSACSDLAALFG